MMTEPIQEMRLKHEETEKNLGKLKLECCGELKDTQGSIFIAVAKPVDSYAGGACLPIYYYDKPQDERQQKWQRESRYSGFDLDGFDEEKAKKVYEFMKMGLPAILAVKATYESTDIEEVREKLPKRKAKIIGLSADYSGRGKTMLAAVISHLKPEMGVVSGGVFSDNDVEKYIKAIEGMTIDPNFFDFEKAVEQMKAVARTGKKLEGGTVKDVMDRVWKAWFDNEDKGIILIDLPGRSEEADYPTNSFGLLRFAMACFDAQRLDFDEGGQISAAIDIPAEVIRDYWIKFDGDGLSGVLFEEKFFDTIFEKAVENK